MLFRSAKQDPKIEIEYLFTESLGDKNLTDPLWKLPQKGVFTEDFQGELLTGATDMVVHSWKDLPTELKTETIIAATLPRADQRDLLLVKRKNFDKINSSKHLQVFSSSPRREYNLTDFFKTHLPFGLHTVKFESVRGNIPTRIRKLLETENVDGLIVAKAALDRLLSAKQPEFAETQQLLRDYLEQLDWVVLPLSVNPNAAAQGALAVEIMANREDLKELLKKIDDPTTYACAQKERRVLASFGGGCHQKIGIAVLARPYGEITFLKGLTDAGQILDERSLLPTHQVLKFPENQMWTQESKSERLPLGKWALPAHTNAVFVARADAWPADFQFTKFVWAAGLKTWQKLAQKGIWVHGCSEGLGEQEDPQLQVLAQTDLHWIKLSHSEGREKSDMMPLIATYTLKVQNTDDEDLSDKQCFFWNSGSQFAHVTQAHPDLVIYAVRVDRGLSPADVLRSVPGTHWAKERGLNEIGRAHV